MIVDLGRVLEVLLSSLRLSRVGEALEIFFRRKTELTCCDDDRPLPWGEIDRWDGGGTFITTDPKGMAGSEANSDASSRPRQFGDIARKLVGEDACLSRADLGCGRITAGITRDDRCDKYSSNILFVFLTSEWEELEKGEEKLAVQKRYWEHHISWASWDNHWKELRVKSMQEWDNSVDVSDQFFIHSLPREEGV